MQSNSLRRADKNNGGHPSEAASVSSRRGFILTNAIVAILVALATGLGTGLAGTLYDQVKSAIFAWVFSEKWYAFIVEPKLPDCDVYEASEANKAVADTNLFEWNWSIGQINGNWSGRATKRINKNINYYISGTELAGRAVVYYSSVKRHEGIGTYNLVHADNDGRNNEYYKGFWLGRDCSIKGHPFVKCPMILTKTDEMSSEEARRLLPNGNCSLSEP
jgi:hypothetical protein